MRENKIITASYNNNNNNVMFFDGVDDFIDSDVTARVFMINSGVVSYEKKRKRKRKKRNINDDEEDDLEYDRVAEVLELDELTIAELLRGALLAMRVCLLLLAKALRPFFSTLKDFLIQKMKERIDRRKNSTTDGEWNFFENEWKVLIARALKCVLLMILLRQTRDLVKRTTKTWKILNVYGRLRRKILERARNVKRRAFQSARRFVLEPVSKLRRKVSRMIDIVQVVPRAIVAANFRARAKSSIKFALAILPHAVFFYCSKIVVTKIPLTIRVSLLRTRYCFASVGFLYPIFKTILALENDQEEEIEKWARYWVAIGPLALLADVPFLFTSVSLFWPSWPEMVFVFVFWLVIPIMNGAHFTIDSVFAPLYKKFVVVGDLKGNRNKSSSGSSSSSTSSLSLMMSSALRSSDAEESFDEYSDDEDDDYQNNDDDGYKNKREKRSSPPSSEIIQHSPRSSALPPIYPTTTKTTKKVKRRRHRRQAKGFKSYRSAVARKLGDVSKRVIIVWLRACVSIIWQFNPRLGQISSVALENTTGPLLVCSLFFLVPGIFCKYGCAIAGVFVPCLKSLDIITTPILLTTTATIAKKENLTNKFQSSSSGGGGFVRTNTHNNNSYSLHQRKSKNMSSSIDSEGEGKEEENNDSNNNNNNNDNNNAREGIRNRFKFRTDETKTTTAIVTTVTTTQEHSFLQTNNNNKNNRNEKLRSQLAYWIAWSLLWALAREIGWFPLSRHLELACIYWLHLGGGADIITKKVKHLKDAIISEHLNVIEAALKNANDDEDGAVEAIEATVGNDADVAEVEEEKEKETRLNEGEKKIVVQVVEEIKVEEELNSA